MYLPKPLDDARKTLVNSRWAIGIVPDYKPGAILSKRFENICWIKTSMNESYLSPILNNKLIENE